VKLLTVGAAFLLLTTACARGTGAGQAPNPVAVFESGGQVAPADTDTVKRPAPVPSAPKVPAPTDVSSVPKAVVTGSEVAREAMLVFGDSATSTTVDVGAGQGSDDAEENPFDIDVRSYETHARVEHFVKMFSGPARDRIAARLEAGSRYEPMIRAKFRAGGLPEDMSYLALIESGYNPNAYSRAAAVGMWQFMTATAKGFGLRVDWWVDERRDPVRSTDAAIRFIRALNDQFGSLYLAAAAYNGGPGRVSRGLRRFADEIGDAEGDDRFFALYEENYLPKETKDYVPQLIAAAIVAKNPDRYGMEIMRLEEFAYDSVKVPGATPLAAVAKAVGVTTVDVRALNGHILRGMTPPKSSYWVRVPVGTAAQFDSGFAALDSADRVAYRKVKAKKHDTMTSIAARHRLTARQLSWYNPNTKPLKSGRLRVGEVMLVPTAAVATAAVDVPDPSIERYGGSSGRVVTHVVRRGENLSTIARKYRTNVATLQRLNRLKKSVIFPGQTIVVKGSAKAAPRKAASSSRKSTSKKPSLSTAAKRKSAKKPVRKAAGS
jgi:membrane-bound lytic murein transglycosylase D